MDFIRARSKDEIDNRQEEIINACDTLYSQYGYDGVNFKAISELTTFSRPTIYNYYKTKDEILLTLLKRELLQWQDEFIESTNSINSMSKEEYSTILAKGLAKRVKMFRLLSILFSSLEDNSRIEFLADFYNSVSSVFETIYESTGKYFPQAAEDVRINFQHGAVAYVLGLHAMTSLSDKQISAIRLAGVCVELPGFESLCYQGIYALLTNM